MKHRRQRPNRRGATLIEAALVIPPLLIFLFAIMEFGHAQMVSNVLKGAARMGARLGATDGVSTEQVVAQVRQMLSTAIDPDQVTILVKDGAVFDQGGAAPSQQNDYSNLQDIELEDANSRRLFIVRVSVPYEQVGILPPGTWRWLGSTNINLSGQAVMRHE